MWTVIEQIKVQELNEALNEAILYSLERRRGIVSGIGVRTWEGMRERLENILELLCEAIIWEGDGDKD